MLMNQRSPSQIEIRVALALRLVLWGVGVVTDPLLVTTLKSGRSSRGFHGGDLVKTHWC